MRSLHFAFVLAFACASFTNGQQSFGQTASVDRQLNVVESQWAHRQIQAALDEIRRAQDAYFTWSLAGVHDLFVSNSPDTWGLVRGDVEIDLTPESSATCSVELPLHDESPITVTIRCGDNIQQVLTERVFL